jgi:hypothetical protein
MSLNDTNQKQLRKQMESFFKKSENKSMAIATFSTLYNIMEENNAKDKKNIRIKVKRIR